ncbi:hypothetical protein ACQKP0_13705 [Heyndrickxia sp. NPDC080065]|uniref:hypothetical protein n=1 Tax=Heyndrickxia sp. NPDC080065 TaxID=3390568 RepID=UPI003D033CFD
MKKKGVIAALGGIVFIVSFLFIYWFYFSKPALFPGNAQLMKDINHLFPEASVKKIQDTYNLDERHVFVPFITSENQYGFSCWEWKKNKWKLVAINSIGEPSLWRINKKDPSTYRFIWNMPPNDNLSSIQFYLIKDRNYHVTEGIGNYEPKIQMNKEISLLGKPYGVLKLPNDWVSVMDSIKNIESGKKPDLFFSSLFSNPSIYFGWIPYNQKGKEANLNNILNGNGFSSSSGDIENLLILTEEEIEFTQELSP